MFWKNLQRRLTAVAIFLNQANNKKISNVAKSSYYRAATLLTCSVVEGLVYQLVKSHSASDNNVVEDKSVYREIYKIPASALSVKNDIYICEKNKIPVKIDDNGVTFGKLIIYLKNKGVLHPKEYSALNRVRVERNKLHIQGMGSPDTGYTKNKFNSISKPTDFLTKKLELLLEK